MEKQIAMEGYGGKRTRKKKAEEMGNSLNFQDHFKQEEAGAMLYFMQGEVECLCLPLPSALWLNAPVPPWLGMISLISVAVTS